MSVSLTSQPKAFQLLKPIGGVSASFSGALGALGAGACCVLLPGDDPAQLAESGARIANIVKIREVDPNSMVLNSHSL